MPSNGSTVVNKTSKFAVFDAKGGEQLGNSNTKLRSDWLVLVTLATRDSTRFTIYGIVGGIRLWQYI